MKIKKLLRLFKKPDLNFTPNANVELVVELSFIANTQVSFKNEFGDLKIKRFSSNKWKTNFYKPQNNISPTEFKVFISTPNLTRDEEVKMRINVDGQTVAEKSFAILMDNDYAGWFELNF